MKNTGILLLAVFLSAALLVEVRAAGQAAYRLSERTYRQLSSVHELMQQQRYDEALAGLDRMRPRLEHKAHEHALLLQTYGHLFADTAQYQRAVDALAGSLALNVLPQPATERTLYALAQLQMAVNEPAAALVSLDRWFQLAEDPPPAAHALAGAAYAQVRRYPEAATQLRKAIDLDGKPQESWYRQLLAVYYQSGQYRTAVTLLEEMISRFPQQGDYWLQLSGVYRELGDDAQAMAVMELAYFQGLVAGESELVNLASFYLYMGLPHKAAQLLDKALEEGSVRPSADNWQLVIDAWMQARETDRALAASERALESVQHADLHLKRARLLADKERWPDVIAAIEQAFAGTGLTSPGKAHLLQGIAHYNLDQPARAQSSFGRARSFADSADQARQWLGATHTPAVDHYASAHSSH
ncbi:MAG: tetratricopeptide repeat protein [Thiogranum sp.]